MTIYDMTYPGDPPSVVVQMTQEEFLALCPNRTISLVSIDMETGEMTNSETVPLGDDVRCDLCNDAINPGDQLYLWQYGRGGEKGICAKCFERGFARYCQERM